jgi:hypothetical protein
MIGVGMRNSRRLPPSAGYYGAVTIGAGPALVMP